MSPKDSAAQERLAKALRENLKRRKAAARARGKPKPDAAADPAPDRPNTAQKPG